MSGPKVVRIVTREEIEAICRGHIAMLDAALGSWKALGRRNDCLEADEIAAAERRRDAIASLLEQQRFMDLQTQAPDEIAYLTADMKRRLTRIAEEQARARSKERREAEAAASLLAELRRRGKELDAPLEQALRAAADGAPGADALAAGFELLSSKEASGELSDLAARLRKGAEGPKSFSQWLEQRPPSPDEVALTRLDRLIAELATDDPDAAAAWSVRLASARSDAGRRTLLLDSLEMDLSAAAASRKEFAEAKLRTDIALAELTGVYGEGSEIAARVESASTLSELHAVLAEITNRVEGARRKVAVAARRKAVLEGLASLGYDVTEGMEAAWTEAGRLVVKSSARPDYGVEVGNPEAARMQMRPIAFGAGAAGPDPARDRDAETIWCSDVGHLHEMLASAGGEFAIERSTPIGATPLKRIDGGELLHMAREGRDLQARRLD